MQAVNSYLKGYNTIVTVFPDGSTSRVVIEGSYSTNDVVVPGPMVSGDRHSPNPWNYTARHTVQLRGEKNLYELYGDKWYSTQSSFGCFQGSSDPLVAPVFDRNAVLNLALGKLNEAVRGNLDLAVDLAEMGQTARMLRHASVLLSPRNLVATAAGLLLPKKRIPFSRDMRYEGFGGTRDIANGYLAWKYGWKPAMQSVYSAADESIRFVLNRIRRFSAQASLPGALPPYQCIVNNVPTMMSGSGPAKASCRFVVSLDTGDGFDLLRWTSLNPWGLAWELVPYSFVVDWVYDVGSYLRNLETALLYNLRFREGFVSELVQYNLQYRAGPTAYYASPSALYRLEGASASEKYVDFRRTVLHAYPLPDRPTFQLDLGASQLLSAAALLRQRIRF